MLFKSGDIFRTYGLKPFDLAGESIVLETEQEQEKQFLYFILAILAFSFLLIAFSKKR